MPSQRGARGLGICLELTPSPLAATQAHSLAVGVRIFLLTSFLVVVTACGDDGTGGAGGSGGGGGAGAGGAGGSGGNAPVTCGDTLTCTATQACVVTVVEATCMNNENEADPCPAGTTESLWWRWDPLLLRAHT